MSDDAARPFAGLTDPEALAQEQALLAKAETASPLSRLAIFFRLSGPGSMDAALTLGAETLTAAMLAGAQFGYTSPMAWRCTALQNGSAPATAGS